MANIKKRGLGRGLDALIRPANPAASAGASDVVHAAAERLIHLPPQSIEPNPKQPRRHFDEESLEELAESIRREGVQEPVVVRHVSGRYELVSGERRVRASVMADLDTIPAICRDVSDADMLRLGLIENIQREDLNAIELASAYQDLMAEGGCTQEELAAVVGKKRATVANTLRLLQLPAEVQAEVASGNLSMGHARAILAFDTPAKQRTACRKTIAQGLSVRQLEKLAAQPAAKRAQPSDDKRDPSIVSLEDEMRKRLGTKVVVRPVSATRGAIEIQYYSLDDLDRFLHLLRGRP